MLRGRFVGGKIGITSNTSTSWNHVCVARVGRGTCPSAKFGSSVKRQSPAKALRRSLRHRAAVFCGRGSIQATAFRRSCFNVSDALCRHCDLDSHRHVAGGGGKMRRHSAWTSCSAFILVHIPTRHGHAWSCPLPEFRYFVVRVLSCRPIL